MFSTRIRLHTAVALCTLAVVSCSEDSPTAPTPQPTPQPTIPQVAGTYTGSFNMSVDGVLAGSGTETLTVAQVGAQLTITGSVTIPSLELSFNVPAVTGTINASGFFTQTSPQLSLPPDPTCGAFTAVSASLNFSGNTVRHVEIINTARCGLVEFSGTLTRQ